MYKFFLAQLIAIFYISESTATEYITSHQNIDPLSAASKLAMSGINAQNERMKIVSQNIANIDVTGSVPGGDPYRRKMIFFENTIDPRTGAPIVKVKKVAEDNSDFILKYEPNHPSADANGYVKYPNVNIHIELADAKEASRGVNVNTSSMEIVKSMQSTVLNMMKN